MTSAPALRTSREPDGAYRVMVVDDSAVIRGIIRRTLESDADIAVVASVSNGQHAVESVASKPVDVVVLDIEMPVMDGMTALTKILEIDPGIKVIMASTLTQKNAAISLQALEKGAADYIPKPIAKHEIHSADSFKRELVEKVKALGRARRGAVGAKGRTTVAHQPHATSRKTAGSAIVLRKPSMVVPRVLCIGSSTGGPKALMEVVCGLQDDFHLPILITQHMPKTFTGVLADHLGKAAGRPPAEAVDGEKVRPGHTYIAPGGLHMLVQSKDGSDVIRLDDGPAENFCKPAVDPMLKTASKVYGNSLLVLILTGMGHDGLVGGRIVVESGGTVVAQDEDTSVVWGMPGAVANAGICSAVMPLSKIASHLRKLAGRPVA